MNILAKSITVTKRTRGLNFSTEIFYFMINKTKVIWKKILVTWRLSTISKVCLRTYDRLEEVLLY